MFGAAALLAAGCAEEIVDPESQPAGEPSSIVFTAGVDTRTTLVPDNDPSDGTYHQIHWVNGDKINVDGVEFSTEDDGAKAYFTTKESFVEDNDYVAIYPATAGTELSSVTIPAAQQAAEGDFHSAAAVSVAVSNTTTLDFKNVTSILKFQVPASAASVTISADEPLAGEVSVDYNNGEPTWENVNAVYSVTVTGEFEPEVDYYVTILPGTKTNFTVRIDGVVSRVATTVNAKRSMVMNMGVLPEPIGNGISFNGSVYEISSADGLAAALSNNKVTEVKIVEDIEYSGELWIMKDLTIDLNNHTIEGTSSRFIRVASETEDVIDVVIKNGTILNNVNGGRCVETRSGNVALELNSVVLSTPEKGANQPLTIGGSGENITVDIINNSTISTNHINGYAITTFNPVTMNITDSEVTGWIALNIKTANGSLGSAGSVFNVTNSTLSGTNEVTEGSTNNSTTIMIEDKNVTINVDSESTVKAVSTNSNYAYLVVLGNGGNNESTNAAITGTEVTIEGHLALEGENASYFNPYQVNLTGNTIKFPESYATGISEEGWSVSDPVDGLITVGKMERNLAFSAASATAILGEDFTAPELSGDADGVEYASSNTSVATVDPATGEVTLVAAGETTITATAAETGAYSAGEASYTLTVKKMIYLVPNLNWKDASARFAAYFFVNDTNTWVSMTDSNEDGIYEVEVPDKKYTTVIFCRMNPGTLVNNWENKWNQTSDLNIPSNIDSKKYYYIAGWSAENDDSTWESIDFCKTYFNANGKLYLLPTDEWKQNNERYAAYFFEDGKVEQWYSLTATSGCSYFNGAYGVTPPAGYTNVIFCRMNGGVNGNEWGNKWDQTDDLKVSGGNLYTMPSATWSTVSF